MSAAVRGVVAAGLVKNNDQQSILLKRRAVYQGGHVLLKPEVRHREDSIVCIVDQVGHDEGEIRQLAAAHIRGELRKGNQVIDLGAAVHDVGKVGEYVVAFRVGVYISPRVSDGGQTFRIGFPGFARGEQFANDVVVAHGAGERIVSRDDLAGCEHEVIPDRRMDVGVVLGRQTVLGGKAVQIGHRRIANHVGVAVILFHDQHDMTELRE